MRTNTLNQDDCKVHSAQSDINEPKDLTTYRPNVFRKVAFTLAEVIIVIGVVGLVAALTLPTLISNHNKKVYTTQLKKSYSRLSNAMNMQVAGVSIRDYYSDLVKTGNLSRVNEVTRMFAKAMGATDILLLGEQTERLAYARTLNFSQNLLASVNAAFTPVAWAYDTSCGGYSCGSCGNYSCSYCSANYTNYTIDSYGGLYCCGNYVANCPYIEHGYYICTDSGGQLSVPVDQVYECGSYDCGSYDCSSFGCGGYDTPKVNSDFYKYNQPPKNVISVGTFDSGSFMEVSAIRTKDSVVYYFCCGGHILIDVNGTNKGPNQGGRDIFTFVINYPHYNKLIPYGEGYVCDKLNVSDACTYKVLSEGKMNY